MADRETMELLLERLGGIPDAIRQTLVDHQWSTIPLFENEYAYVPSLAAGSTLKVTSRSSNLFKVEAIVASLPAGATGLIQLGDLVIPEASGTINITGTSLLLDQTATRALTIAGASGPAMLWLSGQLLPGPIGMRLT